MLEGDSHGNVNVWRRGPAATDHVGPGGFPDVTVTHHARTVLFVGSFALGHVFYIIIADVSRPREDGLELTRVMPGIDRMREIRSAPARIMLPIGSGRCRADSRARIVTGTGYSPCIGGISTRDDRPSDRAEVLARTRAATAIDAEPRNEQILESTQSLLHNVND
ncbi:MAG: hypothetical protein ACLPZR_18515 [Solirubrobacteraceae bacterium]